MGLGNAVGFAHMPLGLVPEILDAIDVRLPIREQPGVVDSVVKAEISSTLYEPKVSE